MANELTGVHEEPGADPLLETSFAQLAGLLADTSEAKRGVLVDARLGGDDRGLSIDSGIVELEAHEPLPGRRLEIFEDALVTGVVRDHEQEVLVGLHELGCLVDGQYAAVIGKRVDDHRGVLAGLDDLVEIADRSFADRSGERSVHPHRLFTGEQVATDQVGCGEVFVAGDGRKWPGEPPRHVLDEAGLAATRWPFEQDWEASCVGSLEDLDLVAHRQVIRLRIHRPHASGGTST